MFTTVAAPLTRRLDIYIYMSLIYPDLTIFQKILSSHISNQHIVHDENKFEAKKKENISSENAFRGVWVISSTLIDSSTQFSFTLYSI